MHMGSVTTQRLGKVLVFGVHANTRVANRRCLLKEFLLRFSVIFGNNALVIVSEAHEFALFLSREVGISLGPVGDFRLEHGQEWITFVTH